METIEQPTVSNLDTPEYKSTKVFKSINPYVDIGNLLIEDLDPFDVDQYREHKDAYLKNLARDNVQYLFNKIWELPTERVEDAIVVALPESTTRLPREKPMPSMKSITKWERYAKIKGITQKKKGRMVWDEESKSWKPRWGYQRANDDTKDWLIEIPHQKDAFHDYIGERIEKKKERIAKNEFQRLKNIRNQSRNGDLSVGMTVENKSSEQLARQINRATLSTASVGKFTERLDNEKQPRNSGRKRKFLPNEIDGKSEKSKQLDILKRMESKRQKVDVDKAVGHHVQEEQSVAFETNANDSARSKRRKPTGGQRRSKSGRHSSGRGGKAGVGGKHKGNKSNNARSSKMAKKGNKR